MWWPEGSALARSAGRVLGIVVITVTLAGCGFRPLYASAEQGTTDPRLAAIEVAQIPDRTGQRLTIALRDAFNPSGVAVDPRYRLFVSLATSRREVALRKDGTASRSEITVTANWRLTDLESQAVAFSGIARSGSSVDLVQNEYANVVAEEDARNRAIEDIARDIQARCAIFLDGASAATK